MEKFPGSKSPKIEGFSEKILSKEDVLTALEKYVGESPVVRELSDEKGLYLLEKHKTGENPGETTEYQYLRKGNHTNGVHQFLRTVITVVFYEDGIPVGGHDIARFNEEAGEWIETT